jgi:hypothetical protein
VEPTFDEIGGSGCKVVRDPPWNSRSRHWSWIASAIPCSASNVADTAIAERHDLELLPGGERPVLRFSLMILVRRFESDHSSSRYVLASVNTPPGSASLCVCWPRRRLVVVRASFVHLGVDAWLFTVLCGPVSFYHAVSWACGPARAENAVRGGV